MTIRKLMLWTLAAGLMTCGAAQAQDWAPVATGANSFAPSGAPQTVSGARINRHFGVETENYAAGPDHDLSQATRRDLEQRRDQPAAFGVAYMPVAKNAELYARIGKGGARDTLNGEHDDGWQYGAGAQIGGSARSGFRADFTRQGMPRSDVKANIFSLGFVSRF